MRGMLMRCKTCAFRGRARGEWHNSEHSQHLEIGGEISNAVSSVQKDYMMIMIYESN